MPDPNEQDIIIKAAVLDKLLMWVDSKAVNFDVRKAILESVIKVERGNVDHYPHEGCDCCGPDCDWEWDNDSNGEFWRRV